MQEKTRATYIEVLVDGLEFGAVSIRHWDGRCALQVGTWLRLHMAALTYFEGARLHEHTVSVLSQMQLIRGWTGHVRCEA